LDSIESLSSTLEDDYEDKNVYYQENHVSSEENISPKDQTIDEIKKLIDDSLALKPVPKPALMPVQTPALYPVIDENQTLHLFPTREQLASQFTNHVPAWGALIRYNGERFQVTNICNIDYYLLSFWVMDFLIPDFSNNIPTLAFTSQIKEIIRYIDLFEWNLAREIWI